MILPPFFGYHIPSKDREIYRLKYSHLSNDILSYDIATDKATITYSSSDVLTYTQEVNNSVSSTYLSSDILSYNDPKPELIYSYLNCDILSYDPPPEPPNLVTGIIGYDEDSSAVLSWSTPYNNRSPLLDYIIQYSTGNSLWQTYPDTVSTTNSSFITGLINNVPYQFRIAATNAIGTGEYGYSEIIIPSGGDNSYCQMSLYLPFNNNFQDKSCFSRDIATVSAALNSIAISLDEYKYGGASLFLDGNQDEFTYEYPHLIIGSGQNINWNFNTDFTIEMFIKPLTSIGYGTLLSVRATDSYNYPISNDSAVILYRNSNQLRFTFNLSYYNYNTGESLSESKEIIASNVNFVTNDWTHIAVCRSKNRMKMYINGNTTGNIIVTDIGPKVSGYNMYIGANINPYPGYGTNSYDGFGGYIDQVIVSSGAKYRSNFTPSEYTLPYDCSCMSPKPACDLQIALI